MRLKGPWKPRSADECERCKKAASRGVSVSARLSAVTKTRTQSTKSYEGV